MKFMHIIACVALMLAMTSDPAIAKKDKKNDDSGKKHSEQAEKGKNKSKNADGDSDKSDDSDGKAAGKDKDGKNDSSDKDNDDDKDKKIDETKKEDEKPVSDKWTADDIKGFCLAKEAAGSRALDDCIGRNQRRIGRAKSQFDVNEIERGKQE